MDVMYTNRLGAVIALVISGIASAVKIALGVFLLPQVWILSVASIALYIASVLGSKPAVGTDNARGSAG